MFTTTADLLWRYRESFNIPPKFALPFPGGLRLDAIPGRLFPVSSIQAAQLSLEALAYHLESSRSSQDPAKWDVYGLVFNKLTQPRIPFLTLRVTPNPSGAASSIDSEDDIGEQDTLNSAVTVEGMDTIPDPPPKLPHTYCTAAQTDKDHPLDPRISILLVSIALTKLVFIHEPETKIVADGFGVGHKFTRALPNQRAFITVQVLDPYVGTPEEITWALTSQVLRLVAVLLEHPHHVGPAIHDCRVGGKAPFLRIETGRMTDQQMDTLTSTPDQGPPSVFDDIAAKPFGDLVNVDVLNS